MKRRQDRIVMKTTPEQKNTGTREIINDILRDLAQTNRNIVSDEFEQGLDCLAKFVDLKVHRYPSGTDCWTWNVPKKWKIREAYIKKGNQTVATYADHPLHVMCYSVPVSARMLGRDLKEHMSVHAETPTAIPYEFSFYVPKWGFCLTRAQSEKILDHEEYDVLIDSEFVDDQLSVGEYTVKGTSDEHIYFLSHLDHPSQVNDGLIGVAANVALAKNLEQVKGHYYNYTFLFVPESIGSIAYLSHHEPLIPRIRFSVFVEMLGLQNPLVIQRSFGDRGLINRYAAHVLRSVQGEAKSYPFLTVAGNDEKIFDSPGVNIPSISLTRVDQETRLKKAADTPAGLVYPYPEYHSHLDDLALANVDAVCGAVGALRELCRVIEADYIPKRTFKGPVFLTKYGLWKDWRKDLKASGDITELMYALEGDKTVFQIAEQIGMDFEALLGLLDKFHQNGLITQERIPVEFDRKS